MIYIERPNVFHGSRTFWPKYTIKSREKMQGSAEKPNSSNNAGGELFLL
jgi:hypothetical protein